MRPVLDARVDSLASVIEKHEARTGLSCEVLMPVSSLLTVYLFELKLVDSLANLSSTSPPPPPLRCHRTTRLVQTYIRRSLIPVIDSAASVIEKHECRRRSCVATAD